MRLVVSIDLARETIIGVPSICDSAVIAFVSIVPFNVYMAEIGGGGVVCGIVYAGIKALQVTLMGKGRHLTSRNRTLCRWPVKMLSFLAALLIVCFSARSSPALQGNAGSAADKKTTVVRAKSRITVDGLLDEIDWLEIP